MMVFISWFFLRASVMLFVLRLLPPFKKVQQKIIYAAFFVNFAITVIGTVSYGVSCRPLRASWENVPGGKCYTRNLLVITTRVNGSEFGTHYSPSKKLTPPLQSSPASSTSSPPWSPSSCSGTSRWRPEPNALSTSSSPWASSPRPPASAASSPSTRKP